LIKTKPEYITVQNKYL